MKNITISVVAACILLLGSTGCSGLIVRDFRLSGKTDSPIEVRAGIVTETAVFIRASGVRGGVFSMNSVAPQQPEP